MGGTRTLADENGNFTLEEIGAGLYTVSANAGDLASNDVELDITAGRENKVDLVVRETVEIEGTFEAPGIPENARFAIMNVWIVKGDEKTPAPRDVNSANVDLKKKTFRARRLQPGSYQVSLSVFGQEGKRAEYKPLPVEVPPGGAKNMTLKFVELPPGEKPATPSLPFGDR
jgi:hypothetical protein